MVVVVVVVMVVVVVVMVVVVVQNGVITPVRICQISLKYLLFSFTLIQFLLNFVGHI
jgi:hypothetical protein